MLAGGEDRLMMGQISVGGTKSSSRPRPRRRNTLTTTIMKHTNRLEEDIAAEGVEAALDALLVALMHLNIKNLPMQDKTISQPLKKQQPCQNRLLSLPLLDLDEEEVADEDGEGAVVALMMPPRDEQDELRSLKGLLQRPGLGLGLWMKGCQLPGDWCGL
jgi:hypothetical protein